MLKLKQKLLFSCLLPTLTMGQLLLITAKPVAANHDLCSGTADSSERCITAQREAANVQCFENNSGNNTAIASCVDRVTAHFNHTGSREDAPPLPAGAITSAPANYSGDCEDPNPGKENCAIIAYLLDFINILSAVVGIVSVIMIAVWGIQYTVARDNAQMTATARLRLLQTVLALVAYLFVYAFLQWIVPGGVF